MRCSGERRGRLKKIFEGVLTDKGFAYPAQNGAGMFVNSENGK